MTKINITNTTDNQKYVFLYLNNTYVTILKLLKVWYNNWYTNLKHIYSNRYNIIISIITYILFLLICS